VGDFCFAAVGAIPAPGYFTARDDDAISATPIEVFLPSRKPATPPALRFSEAAIRPSCTHPDMYLT